MFKKKSYHKLLFFLFLCIFSKTFCTTNQILQNGTITYSFYSNSRFGNHILAYTKAKLLARAFNMKLLCNFTKEPYCQKLKMYQKEQHYKQQDQIKFNKIIKLDQNTKNPQKLIVTENNNQNLFVVHFEFDLKKVGLDEFNSNQNFVSELRSMISPNFTLKKMDLPNDCTTVAVHVRKGGGFDKPLFQLTETNSHATSDLKKQYVDYQYPLKFPPDQFYIDQIKKTYSMLGDKPLYIHIFTDDPDPLKIVDKFQTSINNPNIKFTCRKHGNSHDNNVLEDFFAMSKFDCLIRPDSTLSIMAQIIGNHKIVIYPTDFLWEKSKLVITKTEVINRQ